MILNPIAIAGKQLTTTTVDCKFAYGLQGGANRTPITIPVADGPPQYAGMRQDARVLTLEFTPKERTGVDVGYVEMQALALVGPSGSALKTLTVQRTDGPDIGTQFEAQVAVGKYSYSSRNSVLVELHMTDDTWYERTDTILPQVAFNGAVAIPLLNHGGATVAPVIEVGYSAQRVTQTATVGWKYRRTKTVSNGSDRNWNRVRLTIDLGDTAAWVTGSKALASGDDVRVRFEGRELYRTLTNFNTKRTFVHFVGTIPAGGSATYEVVYGNPAATAPRTLSTRGGNYDTYVADDLGGYSGTATSGTTTTLTDSGATWDTSEWISGFIGLVSGTGSVRYRRIISNTGTVITFNRPVGTAPAAGTGYILWKSAIYVDGGLVTAKTANTITDTAHTAKWCPDSLDGGTVTFIAGSLASPATMTIASNTLDTITFTTSFSVQPAVNDQYQIERYGVLNYHVDKSIPSTANRTQRGLWRTSKYSSDGGRTRFGDQVPGGFIPWLMVDNPDQFAQLDVTDETAGASVSNWPYLSARRRVRSDLTMPQKGGADGVCLYDPRGLVALDWNYRMENDNGIGAVVVMTQEPDGDNWDTIASDTTVRGSMVAVTSGGAAGQLSLLGDVEPVRLYLGVIPANGVTSEIASTESKDRNAEVRNHTKMLVYLSVDECGGLANSIWSIGSEVDIYDLNVTGRLGGGEIGAETPTYYTFAAGGDGHYVHLASGQRLRINPSPTADAPLLGIYSGSTLVSRAPWAAVLKRYEKNLDGINTDLVDYRLALPPGSNLITGEDSTTGWSIANSAGVTASISNDTGVLFDGGTTSLKITVTTTPAGAWTITLTLTAGRLTVVPGMLYEFGFLRRRNALTNAITAQMTVTWSYGGGTPSAVDVAQTIGGAMAAADTWYPSGTGRKIHAGSVATPATTEAAVSIVIAGTGSTSGSIYLDPITLGVPNLYLDEAQIGTLTADIFWRESWIA